MRSTAMIRSSFIAASAVLLLAAGCGSDNNKTCSDACNNLINCLSTLHVLPGDFCYPPGTHTNCLDNTNYGSLGACINHCNASTCSNTQQLVNCGAGVQCNSLSQAETDTYACFVNSGCQP